MFQYMNCTEYVCDCIIWYTAGVFFHLRQWVNLEWHHLKQVVPWIVIDNWCDRAFFKLVSKVVLCLLWFCSTSLSDWLKKARATFLTNQKQNQNQSWLARTHFPALDTNYLYLLQFLIGSFCVLFLLWFVRVIALVLRHSFENRFKEAFKDTGIQPAWFVLSTQISLAKVRSYSSSWYFLMVLSIYFYI